MRAPLLSTLVVFLIALGIGASVPMMTVHHHLKSEPIPEKSNQLFFVQLDNWREEEAFYRPDNPPNAITYQDALNLQESDIPTYKAPMYLSNTTVRYEDNSSLRPLKVPTRMTGKDFFTMFNVPFYNGGAWSEKDEGERRQVAVISRILSERLFGDKPGVGERILINGSYFTIVGVIDRWNLTPRFYDMNDPFGAVEHIYLPSSLVFSLGIQPEYWRAPHGLGQPLTSSTFESLFTNSEIVFIQYWVQLDTEEQAQLYREFLDRYVTDQKALGRFPRNLNNRLSNTVKWIEKSTETSQDAGGVVALLVVMLLFFGVCLINSISILLTKFLRYKSHSSILRALGAPQRFVFTQYLLEVVGLAILGGLLGIVFAYYGLEVARSLYEADAAQAATGLLADQSFNEFWTLDTTMIITSFTMAVIGGLIAGIYPAWRVCKIPPSVELKSN
jgi:putative ABC transport system permease protein